jgi:pimeloyl-ACP methyl ester carboxylesterase
MRIKHASATVCLLSAGRARAHGEERESARAAAEESALMIPMAAQFQSYHSVRCPACIFHVTADQISEADQARNLHGALHRSDLHLVPNAGHMVIYADTADIAEAVGTVGGLVAGRTAPGETRTDQRSG